MTWEYRDAVRKALKLLILLPGGTGSGKTESAMRLADGLAGGQKFAVLDTENGRALHKADEYNFAHAALDAPFTPERYIEAVKAAEEAGFPVIVIDSGSHEYEGVGGVLDIQAEEFEKMGARESARMSSWILPKQRHKRFVQELLRSPAHIIMCLRAEDKIEIVKEGGKTVVRPRQSLTGAQGWVPICEKRLPFEATISLLLLQENPGVPVPIKLEARHAEMIPLDRQLDEGVGKALAEWARGDGKATSSRRRAPKKSDEEPSTRRRQEAADSPPPSSSDDIDLDSDEAALAAFLLSLDTDDEELVALAEALARDVFTLSATDSLPSIAEHVASGDADWLKRQKKRTQEALDKVPI